jgi:hypothetical protein
MSDPSPTPATDLGAHTHREPRANRMAIVWPNIEGAAPVVGWWQGPPLCEFTTTWRNLGLAQVEAWVYADEARAAPDLLAALMRLVDECDFDPRDATGTFCIAAARAAIARAKGR